MIGDIRRVRLRSTQTRTWEREERAPARTEVAFAPEFPRPPRVKGFRVDPDTAVTAKIIPMLWDGPYPQREKLEMFKIAGCHQTDNDCMDPVPVTSKDATSATLTKLQAHSTCQLQIRAVAAADSGYRDSEPVTVTQTTDKTQLSLVDGLRKVETPLPLTGICNALVAGHPAHRQRALGHQGGQHRQGQLMNLYFISI